MKESLLLLFLLVSCASKNARIPSSTHPETWKDYLEAESGPLADHFGEDAPYVLLPWKKSQEIGTDGSELRPSQLKRIPFQCHNKNLYPTHPQQYTKEYFFGVTAPFDYAHLPGTSTSCLTPGFKQKYCLRAQQANVVVISDTYQDSCGHQYRGFWMVTYRTGGGPGKSEDNMGTLFSRGRTLYEKPHAQFPGAEFVTGPTYSVDSNFFLFLSPLFPGDKEKIQSALKEVQKQGFHQKGYLFIPPKR